MWAATAATRPGASSASCTARQRSSDRPVTTTFAPAARCPCARAKPMPRVPPVMIAVRPDRSKRLRSLSAFIFRLCRCPHRVAEGLTRGGEHLGGREDLVTVLQRYRCLDVGGIQVRSEHLLGHLQPEGAVGQQDLRRFHARGCGAGRRRPLRTPDRCVRPPRRRPPRGEDQIGCTRCADEFGQRVTDADVASGQAELDELGAEQCAAAAMRRSQAAARPSPPPTAAPLTAAITGWGRAITFGTSPATNSWVRMPAAGPVRVSAVGATAGCERSRPEQKPRPAPVRITTRLSDSASASRVSYNCDTISMLSALSRSGLLRVTTVRCGVGCSVRTRFTSVM